jgi:hypothetical protein
LIGGLAACGAEEDVSPTFADRIPPGFELKAASRSIELGTGSTLDGVLTQGDDALDGETVRIDEDPYPFDGDFSPVVTTTTNARGRFDVAVKPDSNTAFRAVFGEGSETQSRPVRVVVNPRMALSVSDRGDATVFTTTYRHPEDRSLADSNVFHYVTTRAEASATGELPFARVTSIVQKKPGVSTARVVVGGSAGSDLVYEQCVKYTGSAGMGKPGNSCSQTSIEFRPAKK